MQIIYKLLIFLTISTSAYATAEQYCGNFTLALHNNTQENLFVDYTLPSDAGTPAKGIVVTPGVTLPLVTAINPYHGFLVSQPHDDVWVSVQIYNAAHTQLFNGAIVKNKPRLIPIAIQNVLVEMSVDPAGKIYKKDDATFDDAHYLYKEEKFDGNCDENQAGKYTIEISSRE